jgi:hypothetical protein
MIASVFLALKINMRTDIGEMPLFESIKEGILIMIAMNENIYSLLMRKYILGLTTDEEDDVLFDWLDKDEGHFNYLTWFSAYLQSTNEHERKALTRDRPEDGNFWMSDEELSALLGRLSRTWGL